MTRKDKKQDKAMARRPDEAKGDGKPKRKSKREADGKEARKLGSKEREAFKPKAPKKRRGADSASLSLPLGPPATATAITSSPPTRSLDAEVLPRIQLDHGYDLTADGDDLEALGTDAPELGFGGVPPTARFEDPLESLHPSVGQGGDVEAQIRALEARLDGLIQGAASQRTPQAIPATEDTERERELAAAQAIAMESAAELAGSQYYVKKWGRQGLRARAEVVDEFGLDRSFDAKLRPVLDFIYRRYFRIQTEGIENVPDEGRAVIVGNHSGSVPIDGLMLRTALRVDHAQSRDLRWLAEDFLFYLPFAGVFMNRAGAVRACQENAERLLVRDNVIAVFPEGVQGIRKLFRDRYRLQRFGRGGYIRLCLRTRAPLIPCAIIGGEEASPLLYRFDALADLLRIPYLPITPGLLPAPTKWRIKFGEPISFDNYGPEAADDDLLVGRLSDRVRSTIQGMLETGLQKRRSIWF